MTLPQAQAMRKRFIFLFSLDFYRKRRAWLALTTGGNMYLQWKKSGRSECGNYQANRNAAYYIAGATVKLADKAESAAENRAICQRHAWKIAAQQAINEICAKIGGAELSHALKVDSSQVSRWKLGRALVPARHCERINILDLNMTLKKLRPDLQFSYAGASLTWRKRSVVQGGAES